MEIILDSYGTFVQMKNKMLFIVPKNKENIYVPLDKIGTLIVTPGVRLTSDVLFSLMHHQVDVIFQTRRGYVKGRVWNHEFGSIADIRKNQLRLAKGEVACRWMINIIFRKINNQKEMITDLYQKYIDYAEHPGSVLQNIERCLNRIDLLPSHSIATIEDELRNLEARAARYYWAWIQKLIPSVYQFPGRVTRGAKDPVNSMLSYGYGMLYHKIESALIKVGLDPQIGWFHKNQYNKPVLTFDVIEPFRVWIDLQVIGLARDLTIPKALFKFEGNRCVMTRPARKILAVTINKFLDQRVRYDGKKQKRSYILFLEAQSLASKIKKR